MNMEGQVSKKPTAVSSRVPSSDPVKEQGILQEVNRKARTAARQWDQKWGFYRNIREIQEGEALKSGMTLEEYRKAVNSMSSMPEPKQHPVAVDPSPAPIPRTSYGMVGRRASCPLERYGRLVVTGRDIPIHPPLQPGQVYDPYKQTMIFLGSVEGDPISYKLPPAPCEVTDEMWARPQQLGVIQLSYDKLEEALRRRNDKTERRFYRRW